MSDMRVRADPAVSWAVEVGTGEKAVGKKEGRVVKKVLEEAKAQKPEYETFKVKFTRLLKSTFSVGIYNIVLQKQFRKEFTQITAHAATRESRIQAAFDFLKSREDLGSRVSMQGATQDLTMRMDSILGRLKSENKGEKAHALAEGERLLETLSKRVTRNLRVEVLKTAFKIVAVTLAVLLTVGVVGSLVYAAPISLGLLGLVGVGILAYKKTRLSKELFSLPEAIQPKINAQKFADANVKKAANDYKGCLQDLKEAYPESFQKKFPSKLQERLTQLESQHKDKEAVDLFEKCRDHLMDPQKRVKYEEEGLELLAKIVVPETKGKKKAKGRGELAQAEQAKLAEFLDYSYNNRIFNTRLQSLTSPGAAETFAARYSHKTGMEKGFHKVLERMEPAVKAFEPLGEFTGFIEQTSVDIAHRISILTKPGEGTPEIIQCLRGEVDQDKLNALEKSLKELSQTNFKSPFDKDYPKWGKEFSQSVDDFRKSFLTEAQEVYQGKKEAYGKLPEGSKERAELEKSAKLIEQDINAVQRLTEDLKASIPTTDAVSAEIEKVKDLVIGRLTYKEKDEKGVEKLKETEPFRGRGDLVKKRLKPLSQSLAQLRDCMNRTEVEDPKAYCAELSDRLEKIQELYANVVQAIKNVAEKPEMTRRLKEVTNLIEAAQEALSKISGTIQPGFVAVQRDFQELRKPASEIPALLKLLEGSTSPAKVAELQKHLKALEEYSHMSPYQKDFETWAESFVKHAYDFRHGYTPEAEKLLEKKQTQLEAAGENEELQEKLKEEVKALKAAIKEVKDRGIAIEKRCPHACLKMRAPLVDVKAEKLFSQLDGKITEERLDKLKEMYKKVSTGLRQFDQKTTSKEGYEEWAQELRKNMKGFHEAYANACKDAKVSPAERAQFTQAKDALNDMIEPFVELNPAPPDPEKSKKLGVTMQPFHVRAEMLYETCKENLEKLPDFKKFGLHEIELIETFSKLGEMLPQASGIPTLQDLFKKCDQASTTLGKLDTIIQATGNFEAGDIIFPDEIQLRRFEGKPSFSKAGEGTKTEFLKEVRDWITKGKSPWLLQPWFTGHLTHAAIMNVQESSIVAGEIISTFDNSEPSFAEATYNVRYRPDFDKLVTPEGFQELQKLYPDKSRKEILENIKFRYQRKVSSLLKSENENFKKIQFSGWKAGLSWWNAKFRETVPRLDDAVVKTELREMFCSEFAATIMSAAFANLQKDLQDELGEKVKIFHDIIPTNVPFANVFPNRLADFITSKGFFTEERARPLVDLLVDTAIPNPRRQKAPKSRAAA
jgi:hypothetical protein